MNLPETVSRHWRHSRVAHPLAYVPAVTATLLAFSLTYLLRDTLQTITATPFLGAIAFGAWRGRWRAALLSLGISVLLFTGLLAVFSQDPPRSIVLRVILFVAVSGGIVYIVDEVLRARDQLTVHTDALQQQTAQLQRQAAELEAQAAELDGVARAHTLSESRYRLLFEATQDGVILYARSGRPLAVNASALRILGLSESALMGRTPMHPDWRVSYPDGRPFPAKDFPAQVACDTGIPQHSVVMGVERPDGSRAWIVVNANPLEHADENNRLVVLSFTDVTELLSSQNSLRETQAQLRQAQKMEAVGQLAGGIAHDFNNLLTVITAFTELLALDIPADSGRRADLDEIRRASGRAADLTRQLLAFSRKQVLRPRAVHLNRTVTNMGRMLERLIGEDVRVVTRLAADTAEISADEGQLEQVIANLSVNARDAMPAGGTLIIETANVAVRSPYVSGDEVAVPAGDYVVLSVTDTGVGMSLAIRERVFEPFFTTKDAGKGTGLGLSTVYGIVKQSGGHIWLDSVMGAGTTFKLFFPKRHETDAADPPSIATTGEFPVSPPGRVVLLVEDESAVRSATRRMLERSGYSVLDAASAHTALEIAESHEGAIDLLLTDIVMPGMSGSELARVMTTMFPAVRVLLMSGYSEGMAARQWTLPTDAVLLEKPFSAASLARKVGEVMGR